jgi:microcystin-dependent protein
MAYQVRFTDSANKGNLIVDDNTINQETSLDIPGRQTTAYGTAIAENFLHLLENFANTTEPKNPVEGQLWYNNSEGVNQLQVYDGTSWASAGGLKKALEEPDVANSVAGDLWVDTGTQQLYLFSGSGWVLVGPEFSDGLKTGATSTQITGVDDVAHTVLIIEVRTYPVAIVSIDEFTPKTTIEGFTTIYPGINLSTRNFAADGAPKLFGPVEKAENLIVGATVVPSANFLRSDQSNIANFPLKIKNDGGLTVGVGSQLQIGVATNTGIIQNTTNGASIDFRVKNDEVVSTVLTLDPNQRVGINNAAPQSEFDVVGNTILTGTVAIEDFTQSTSLGTGSITSKGGASFAKNLYVGGTASIAGQMLTENVIPDVNNARQLGTELLRWQSVYASNFYGNIVGNLTGTVSGKSSSTDKLASSTTFNMTGDITSPAFSFDGQAGGSTKTFTTTISNGFIANKTPTGITQNDDEILINRISGTTGVFKTTKAAFLSSVAVNPPGAIVSFAGTTIPNGWLLCNGAEVDQLTYPTLFGIIEFTFKDAGLLSDLGVAKFALPDLRGRFPLGLDNMGGSAADRVTGLQASELGNTGGSENITIEANNLPDHAHSLAAENGDQFYSINDTPIDAASDPAAVGVDAPADSGNGQGLATTSGMVGTTGQAIDVLNPFLSINYIIYTGDL